MTRRRHLFEYLTREEWKTLYALAFLDGTDHYGGAYPLRRYADPRADETWEEGFYRGLKWLSLEHGVEFTGVAVSRDGEITVPGEPVCEQNLVYLDAFRLGVGANPISAMEVACRWLSRNAPDVNLEPLKGCLADLREQRDAVEVPGEVRDAVMAFRRKALRTIGIEMHEHDKTIN